MVVIQVQLQPHPSKFNGYSQHPFVYNIQRPKKLSLQPKALSSRTQRIMEGIAVGGEVGGAGGAYSYEALKRLDNLWSSICSDQTVVQEPRQVVTNTPGLFSQSDMANKEVDTFDVLVCGGTLGIFIAAAMSLKGLRVGVVERNLLKGREQEWNISRKELLELVEVEQMPAKLIDIMRERFTSLGGVIFEGCGVSSINVYQDIAVLQLMEGKILSASLIIDAMGNFSPVLKQIRGNRKPDGVCLVVGSCCRGFKENSRSDVIFSSAEVKQVGNSEAQYFWEAFPAGSGPLDRTTYMFTYVQPQPISPKLEELLEDYWDLMPKYQSIASSFRSYSTGVILNLLKFGDASGIQSPVSFGGFGSLTRHLGRLSDGIHEAISGNLLDSDNLSLLNPYMKLGDPVLRPFLQDVIQFGPLVKTLGLVMLTKPQILPSIFKQVGFPVLIDWLGHFSLLGCYTFLSIYIDPLIRPLIDTLSTEDKYKWKRQLEAWKYGAGLDYKFNHEDMTNR
ncbi:hypothetical protein L1987_49451 [Smallanthus sonchifolius]|uniref:Uncharacterized protein n=1 Tax=Smallanthus sonchifolius TaxID=185202 RepID=A0ACB9FVS3_9ASTR|nr:hypothetical protein L1987_49451 [Smallanthus sonchifolius]